MKLSEKEIKESEQDYNELLEDLELEALDEHIEMLSDLKRKENEPK